MPRGPGDTYGACSSPSPLCSSGGQTWSPNGNPALVGTFRDAFFLPGGQEGWLVSDDVWHSTDGGQTWALQYAGGISLASVCFVDAQHGWASGFVNTLLHTDDGGVTWTPQDPGGPAGAAYTSVSAISPLEAIVVGWDDFVARTTDGGQTWVQEFPPDLSRVPDLVEWNAAILLAPGDAWIGGNAGIYRSGDGWQVVGTSFCVGEAGACPCANPGGPGVGCAHAAGHGARLAATGSTHVGAGTLALHASQCPPGVPGLLISGTVAVNGGAGAPFGDGLRCAGGVVTRLQVVVADALGEASSSVDVAAKDGAQAGQTRTYQLWYRDPVNSPCGAAFNLTNGLAVTWDS
ncbi:MAG: hypothetical protein H6828_04730 [Planctomycetes bacterium]|nr:hypothetical protein [Planctomycetota bacterium]